MVYAYVLLLVAVLTTGSSQQLGDGNGPIVQTAYGALQGFREMDYLNRSYDAFIGVPFAEPPTGELRWAQPARMQSWTGVRNATWWGPHCIQALAIAYPIVEFSTNESEDCLYLNVYVPDSVDETLGKNLPVMLYFYGGGFNFGTAEMYPGEELATTGEVIVVTSNYRTGMMGFLTSGDDVAAGNWGLWDARAAIIWTRENIQFFGGDPNRITIFGQSAGGATVIHNMLSEQSTDLFQRGISISGGAWYSNAINSTLFRLAGRWNCSDNDTQAAVDCLREVPDKELDQSMTGGYSVVFDGPYASDPFLRTTPEESWEAGRGGHIDFMTGYAYHDAAGFALGKILGIPFPNETNDYNRPNTAWFTQWIATYSFYENTAEIVQTLYERFPAMNSSDDAIASEANVKVQTDMGFGADSFDQGEKHSASGGGGSTYQYVFSHRQSFHGGYPQWCNGSHMDDIYSVLGHTFMRFMREALLGEFDDNDDAVRSLLMRYYSNFAYSGDPNSGPHSVPELYWPEYDIAFRRELLETPTPIIQTHTQEVLDHFNWLMYDFPAMMIPPDGEPGMVTHNDHMALLNSVHMEMASHPIDDELYDDEFGYY